LCRRHGIIKVLDEVRSTVGAKLKADIGVFRIGVPKTGGVGISREDYSKFTTRTSR